MKLYQKIILIIAGLGLAMLSGYYILSGFPEYAMLQINKSLERHNWTTFRNFVDVEAILDASYDVEESFQIRNDSLKHVKDTTYHSIFSKEFSAFVKPIEIKAMMEEMHHYVEKGEFENYAQVKLNEKSIASYRKAFNEYSDYTGFSKELKTDSIAIFKLSFKTQNKKPEKSFDVRIRFEKLGHRWKMTGIMNLPELISVLDEIKSKVK